MGNKIVVYSSDGYFKLGLETLIEGVSQKGIVCGGKIAFIDLASLSGSKFFLDDDICHVFFIVSDTRVFELTKNINFSFDVFSLLRKSSTSNAIDRIMYLVVDIMKKNCHYTGVCKNYDGLKVQNLALSSRELDVLDTLYKNGTLKEAAHKLDLSYKTAHVYKTSAFSKLRFLKKKDYAQLFKQAHNISIIHTNMRKTNDFSCPSTDCGICRNVVISPEVRSMRF